MKKILFTHFSLKNGERWGRTFYIAKGLQNLGYEVVLLTTDYNHSIFKMNTEIIDGVKVYSFSDIIPRKICAKGYGVISFVGRIIFSLANKFDYVYSDAGEAPVCGWPCKINQWLYKAKYISEWSDMLGKGGYYDSKPFLFKIMYGKYYLWKVAYFRKTADFVVVLTSFMENYVKSIGINEKKIIIVPGGSMVSEIDYYPIGCNKKIFNIDEDVLTLGYIGVSAKEIEDFLPLIEVIKKHNGKNKIRLLLFGYRIPDSIIISLEIQDIIVQCGWIDFSKESINLSAVDIFILFKPETVISNAGWPNKLGDYMAVGRPVIVTPYGDISDFIKKYSEGFIAINRDDQEIEQLLSNILEGKINLQKMGEINREIAINTISWNARSKILHTRIETNKD